MRLRSFVTAATFCCAATAAAQPAAQEPRQSLGTNLIAIPFGVFSADYERVVGAGGFTVGLGALHAIGDDDGSDGWFDGGGDITWAHAKLKYYPSERRLRGVAIGITAGFVRETDVYLDFGTYDPTRPQPDPRRTRTSDAAPTIGVVVDYNWLLGRRERFLFGIGVGARRVLKDVDESDFLFDGSRRSPLEQVYPDGRFTVGFAF